MYTIKLHDLFLFVPSTIPKLLAIGSIYYNDNGWIEFKCIHFFNNSHNWLIGGSYSTDTAVYNLNINISGTYSNESYPEISRIAKEKFPEYFV